MRINSFNVPQADRLESVIQVVINVNNGARTDVEIIQDIPDLNTDRQGRYYRKAAEILGFIVNQGNDAHLTKAGAELLHNPTATNPGLIEAVINIDVVQRLLPYMELFPEGLTRDRIEKYVSSVVVSKIGPTMLPRRISTIMSWLKTLGVIENRGRKYFLINKFTQSLPVLEIADSEQPILPKSGNLAEYKIVQDRVRKADEIITIYKNQATLDRAVGAHKKLVDLVAKRIVDAGGIPKSNQFIDLAVSFNEDFIFEMKSSTEGNIKSQLRKGLSQLYEYRYIENNLKAKLVLVIENPLSNPVSWMLDYMEKNRDIMLVWNGGNNLHGTLETKNQLPFLSMR
jgi:hypothetical protein